MIKISLFACVALVGFGCSSVYAQGEYTPTWTTLPPLFVSIAGVANASSNGSTPPPQINQIGDGVHGSYSWNWNPDGEDYAYPIAIFDAFTIDFPSCVASGGGGGINASAGAYLYAGIFVNGVGNNSTFSQAAYIPPGTYDQKSASTVTRNHGDIFG